MTFSSLIGERLKEERKSLGLSQAEAAVLVSVTREHWGRCERGATVPGGEMLAGFAAAGGDVLYVLTGNRSNPALAPNLPAQPIPGPLTREEEILLDNYRHTPPDRRRFVSEAAFVASQRDTAKGGGKR